MKEAYEELYAGEDYRKFSPGESRLPDFFKLIPLTPDDVVLDIGCGTGRATKQISKRCKAIGLDFVNAMETDAEFIETDFTKGPLPVKGSVGFCCDVMEHIHPRKVRAVIHNIMKSVDKCYFQICTVPDHFGQGSLHLTVKPFWWWARQMRGIIRYAREEPEHAIFVVQNSYKWREITLKTSLMEDEETLKRNIRENLSRGYREVEPCLVQDRVLDLLAGGPSLDGFGGADCIVSVNGAYNWAVERGFKPAAQIIVDPREFNKRFTQPVVEGCKYLVASWCHPGVAGSLPRDQVYLWHSGEFVKDIMIEKGRDAYQIFGGSTVMLRAIPLLIMLGFRKFRIWGFDSCLIKNEHHAYPQPENDREKVMDVIIGGKTFKCQTWMAAQAQEFIDMVKHVLPDDVQLAVEGNGLIAHILKTGAIYGGISVESL